MEFPESAKFFASLRSGAIERRGEALARAPINLAEEADGRLFLLLTDRRANCCNDQEDVIEGQS